MKKASAAAWDRQWVAAIREYRRALVEFPQDPPAHASLALALKENGNLDEALSEYALARNLLPRDPTLLAQTAALEEKLGQKEQAANDYLTLAEIYVSGNQLDKAVEAWKQATSVSPERAEIREKIFTAYREIGNDRGAARELVALAQIQKKAGDTVRAHLLLRQALSYDPANLQAKAMMNELSGPPSSRSSDAKDNPVDKARRSSLSRLAETVFEEGNRWKRTPSAVPSSAVTEVETILAGAIDSQTHGRTAEAIERYEQIIRAGGAAPEVRFNLALLYKDTLRYDEAIGMLKQVAVDPQFTSAAYYAIGECCRSQGKNDLASENFILAMQSVDLATVDHGQADEVIRVYESLADGYRALGAQANADKYIQTLVDFLSGKGWEDKLRTVRRHLAAVSELGAQASLAEIFGLPESQRVIEALGLTEEHLKEGHLVAATEEAMLAVELAPEYLPAHQRLAEILLKAGLIQEARAKFETLAETAEVRGEIPSAVSYYRQALALAPEDLNRRAKLIDLMVSHGQVPEALDEFMETGAVLERAGEHQQAIDKYAEALRLAERAGAVSTAVPVLKQRMADGYSKLREWEKALVAYQDLCSSDQSDERSKYHVIEISYRLGQRDQGERELEELLARNLNAPVKTRAILFALVRNFPNDLGLNLRLAQADFAAGHKAKAVEELDALGERLLGGGEREAAVQVISEIIRLNPPRVDDYRRLLDELGAGE